jgi:hypothetical protein
LDVDEVGRDGVFARGVGSSALFGKGRVEQGDEGEQTDDDGLKSSRGRVHGRLLRRDSGGRKE